MKLTSNYLSSTLLLLLVSFLLLPATQASIWKGILPTIRHTYYCPSPGIVWNPFRFRRSSRKRNPCDITDDDAPQICGEHQCLYDNVCLATNAGFNVEEGDCKPKPFECPRPTKVTTICSTHEPVACGEEECVYENLCRARAAGYNTNDGQCQIINEFKLCRMSNPLVSCEDVIDRTVVCDGSCEFDNPCLARSAGYNVESQCEVQNENDDICNKPSPTTICPHIYQPIVCDYGNCEFSNPCLAESAGYSVTQECQMKTCHRQVENPPSPDVPCEFNGSNAILCDGICEFHDTCSVARAGFDMATQCVHVHGK